MNDTLSIKKIDSTELLSSEFSVIGDFARIASNDDSQRRVSIHLGSLSPTVLRINHRLPTSSFNALKSIYSVDQSLARVDALGNLLKTDMFRVGLQIERPAGVTEAEMMAAFETLIGSLVETNCATFKALIRGEQ